jgi:UPF0716 family protein affecting phage T7 exclusion
MVTAFSISGRVTRAGAILLAGWLLLEIALMQLVAARIGWAATLALLSIKGGLGLLIIGIMTVRGFRRLKSISEFKAGATSFRTVFGLASGILITLPGLIPPLIGIALFTPSLQHWVLRRITTARSEPGQGKNIDLPEHEWQEIRRKKLATKARSRKASLEAKPPSV